VRQTGVRVPARALRAGWLRSDHPTIELLGARGDLFHGTNFVAPPMRSGRAVVTVHDLTFLEDSVNPANHAYRILLPRALARGAHAVVPTHAVAHALREHYGLPPERVSVTPLGVDAPWFGARPPTEAWLEAHRLPADYVLYVGSSDPRKNLDVLVEAHRLLTRDASCGTSLVLAGPAGAARPSCTPPGVVRTGWLDEQDLRTLVAGSRLLALPSRDEGFGLPVLEALAVGRPVVVSDVPALLEVAGPHATSAPVSDAQALADALRTVLARPDTEPDREARRAWARRWTWDACADATLDVYAEVLGR
jgi:glycosyltransferase involved in cell wall biosynthesis